MYSQRQGFLSPGPVSYTHLDRIVSMIFCNLSWILACTFPCVYPFHCSVCSICLLQPCCDLVSDHYETALSYFFFCRDMYLQDINIKWASIQLYLGRVKRWPHIVMAPLCSLFRSVFCDFVLCRLNFYVSSQ